MAHIKKLVEQTIKTLCRIRYRIDRDLIVFEFRGYSGSNISPLMDKVREGALCDHKVEIINAERDFSLSTGEKLRQMWHRYRLLSKARIVVTTHGPQTIKKKTINVDLWHGFPLKGMNLMDRTALHKAGIGGIDYAASLSQTYSTLVNACFGIDGNIFKVTGYPRNDYLYTSNGKQELSSLLNEDISGRNIVLFMPTFRRSSEKKRVEGDKLFTNFFGFEKFDIDVFDEFLESQNLLFILKLHPNEEQFFKEVFSSHSRNIRLLLGSALTEHSTDLYRIVNAADILISDYSSIYFDYLLLDRPILFTPTDLSSYEETRGFLVNPIGFWLPGAICLTQETLMETLKTCLMKDEFKENRALLRSIVHAYTDADSSSRVIALLEDLMASDRPD